MAVLSTLLFCSTISIQAQQRVLGVDISYWNCGTASAGIAQTNWNTGYSNANRVFTFIRATRGGTTGLSQTSGTPGNPTSETLSRRYDDSRFMQNITRATAAGMMAGPYHFPRPDISGNTGADEADHFIQSAGVFMRPGYMMPMFDQEVAAADGTADTLVQYAIDFSDRIFSVMQIRPCIYINGNYSSIFQGATQARRDRLAKPVTFSPSVMGPAYPMLWDARYSSNASPDSIPIQTGNPRDTFTLSTGYYGPWDDYGNAAPWAFWQFASTTSVPGFNYVDTGIDSDVSHGDIEYVRNFLVPAVWMPTNSGDWSVLTNWNSGQPVVAPVIPADQATPYATGPLPTARLPGAVGTGPTSGQYDTVILEKTNANFTVTFSTGTSNIRKLYMREALNITGGALTINYDPTYRSNNSVDVLHGGPVSAQFSGPVALSGTGSLTVHTLQVDAAQTFTLGGGSLTFNTISLTPNASPAKLFVTNDVTLAPFSNNITAVIIKGTNTGSTGYIDLGNGAARSWNITDGTAEVDVSAEVPITNGALNKTGSGTLRLTGVNTYAGGTTVSAGRLLVNNASGSGTGTGTVTINSGIMGGTGIISGVITLNTGGTIQPGTASAIGKITLGTTPIFAGTNLLRINRNSGVSLADKVVLSTGTLNYGGTLVITNIGATLVGGEVFTNFTASSYAGAFAATNLPILNAGLNWYTAALKTNGTIKVNRQPVVIPLATFSNAAPTVLQIPLASLVSNSTDADNDFITLSTIDLISSNAVPLVTDGTYLFYSNRVSQTDQFNYTITDNHGGTAVGVIKIVNIGSSPSAQFSAMPGMIGGNLNLYFTGVPGWTYYLERSTNLPDWTTIWTNVAPPSGSFDFTDDFHDLGQPADASYYRLRWAP